tara:strand:- start:345 stop:575 length:231 start_codon:yes stop_codon:yes gene_type:complete
MDYDIQRVKELIERKRNKYPNISNIWTKYLEERIKILQLSLKKAENLFMNIDNISEQDLPYSTIALLYLLTQEQVP